MFSRLTTARHTITAATHSCRGISSVHHRPIASPLINIAGAVIVVWTVYVVSNPMSNAQEHTSQHRANWAQEWDKDCFQSLEWALLYD